MKTRQLHGILFVIAFYRNSAERSVIRHNQKYLVENIQPNGQLIDSLMSLDCLTEQQGRLIKRLRLDRDKNVELLHALRPFDEKKRSKFIRCLRQTNQKTVAQVVGTGGGLHFNCISNLY